METDIGLILYLQSFLWAFPVMKLASLLGTKEFFLLLLPAVYWCYSAALGFRLGLILTISYGFNVILKVLWHSPRPYWVSREVEVWAREPSFGLPSGHAQIAVSFWGLLACRLHSSRAWVAAILLSLFIGLSRIYLGVHFPQDVIAGWIAGGLLLCAFLYGESHLRESLSRQSLMMQILISLAASLAMLGFFALSRSILADWQMPELWAAYSLAEAAASVDPLSAKDALQAAGLLFGVASGYALLQQQGGYCAEGPARQKLLRYLLGMAGLVIIWYGLGAISSFAWAVSYLRAVLAGLWVAFVAPLCFQKAGLAEKGHKHNGAGQK
ncbi:MAG: phosphatase PAP2 family protein [Methanotrichaceae archaeon]|nr:phosphatase PAP2 family protein [Methanotrichaceae archaeon]